MKNILLFLMLYSWGISQVIVRGRITDARGTPLSYATIFIYSMDTVLKGGAISDTLGNFSIKVERGKYRIRASYLGYENYDTVIFLREDKNMDIIMKEQDIVKGEAVVEASRPLFQISHEKKVYNVSQDPTSAGQTLKDVIAKMPGVSIDEDGNIKIRGEPISQLYINGHLSIFSNDPDKFLESIKADAVEKVEIITNRTAKYEAEGTGAILNIVLKEGNNNDFYGNVSAGAGYPETYNLSLIGELRRSTWTMSLMYSFNNTSRIGYASHIRRYQGGGMATQFSHFENLIYNHLISFELMRKIKNVNLSASVNGRWRRSDDTRQNTGTGILGNYKRYSNGAETEYEVEPLLKMEGKWGNFSTENTLRFEYENQVSEEAIAEYEFLGSYEKYGNTTEIKNTMELPIRKPSDNIEFKSDNTYKVTDSLKVEFGVMLRNRTLKGTTYTQSDYGTPNSTTLDDTLAQYNDNNLSLYVQLSHTLKNYFYTIGARYERVRTLYQGITDIENNYENVFPNFLMGFNVGKLVVQGSYSFRIKRPGFHIFRSTHTYADKYNYFGGNRKIRPSFTHSIELSVFPEKINMSPVQLYLRISKDMIGRMRVPRGNILIMQPYNFDRFVQGGMEVNLPLPLKWINKYATIIIGGEFSYQYVRHHDSLVSIDMAYYDVNTRVVVRTREIKGYGIQGIGVWLPAAKMPFGRHIDFFWVDASIYKKVSDKVKITLSVSDVLNRRRFGGEFNYGYMEVSTRFRPTQRTYTLNISVDIGQSKPKARRPQLRPEMPQEEMF